MMTFALLPGHPGVPALMGCAAVAGAAQPPVGACMRSLWPVLAPDADLRHAAYALEGAAMEIIYILGPVAIVGGIGTWSLQAAILACAGFVLAGDLLFSLHPASARWRPAEIAERHPLGALRGPGVRVLVAVFALLGLSVGAVEVAVPATLEPLGHERLTGLMLGLWGLGSLLTSLAVARAGAASDPPRRLAALLVAWGATHAALALAIGPLTLGGLLLLAGGAISPTLVYANAMLDHLAPDGTLDRGVHLDHRGPDGRDGDRRRGRRRGGRARLALGGVRDARRRRRARRRDRPGHRARPAAPAGRRPVIYRLLYALVLRRIPPETAHALAARGVRLATPARAAAAPRPPRTRGSASTRSACASPARSAWRPGSTRTRRWFEGLGALGFGFVEVGTVTAGGAGRQPAAARAAALADRALQNSMGFPNPGAEAVARRIGRRAGAAGRRDVLGVNVGRAKGSSTEQAADDYRATVRRLAAHADYLALNVSSPNTPGLRDLQAVEPLRALVAAVREELAALGLERPVLVKIAPDLADEDVDAIADLALELGLAGVIATNTTVDRSGLASPGVPPEGGISGPPLAARSLAVLRRLRAQGGRRARARLRRRGRERRRRVGAPAGRRDARAVLHRLRLRRPGAGRGGSTASSRGGCEPRPRQESNLHPALRRRVLYPLSYEGLRAQD